MADKTTGDLWDEIQKLEISNWILSYDPATLRYEVVITLNPRQINYIHSTAASQFEIRWMSAEDVISTGTNPRPDPLLQSQDFSGQMVIFDEVQIYNSNQLPGWDVITKQGKDADIVGYSPMRDAYIRDTEDGITYSSAKNLVGYYREVPYNGPLQARYDWLSDRIVSEDKSYEALDQQYRTQLMNQIFVGYNYTHMYGEQSQALTDWSTFQAQLDEMTTLQLAQLAQVTGESFHKYAVADSSLRNLSAADNYLPISEEAWKLLQPAYLDANINFSNPEDIKSFFATRLKEMGYSVPEESLDDLSIQLMGWDPASPDGDTRWQTIPENIFDALGEDTVNAILASNGLDNRQQLIDMLIEGGYIPSLAPGDSELTNYTGLFSTTLLNMSDNLANSGDQYIAQHIIDMARRQANYWYPSSIEAHQKIEQLGGVISAIQGVGDIFDVSISDVVGAYQQIYDYYKSDFDRNALNYSVVTEYESQHKKQADDEAYQNSTGGRIETLIHIGAFVASFLPSTAPVGLFGRAVWAAGHAVQAAELGLTVRDALQGNTLAWVGLAAMLGLGYKGLMADDIPAGLADDILNIGDDFVYESDDILTSGKMINNEAEASLDAANSMSYITEDPEHSMIAQSEDGMCGPACAVKMLQDEGVIVSEADLSAVARKNAPRGTKGTQVSGIAEAINELNTSPGARPYAAAARKFGNPSTAFMKLTDAGPWIAGVFPGKSGHAVIVIGISGDIVTVLDPSGTWLSSGVRSAYGIRGTLSLDVFIEIWRNPTTKTFQYVTRIP